MRYSRAVIERFYARAHPKRPNRQQVNIYQWLEAVVLNFFFHRAHYGPSASKYHGHVIKIVRHQYKPTRFIILFIA